MIRAGRAYGNRSVALAAAWSVPVTSRSGSPPRRRSSSNVSKLVSKRRRASAVRSGSSGPSRPASRSRARSRWSSPRRSAAGGRRAPRPRGRWPRPRRAARSTVSSDDQKRTVFAIVSSSAASASGSSTTSRILEQRRVGVERVADRVHELEPRAEVLVERRAGDRRRDPPPPRPWTRGTCPPRAGSRTARHDPLAGLLPSGRSGGGRGRRGLSPWTRSLDNASGRWYGCRTSSLDTRVYF